MLKIIIADDEKWVRMTIKALLPYEKLGLVLASEASNGIEALELCKQHEPDILITDIMMPGLTGIELIRELRTLLPDLRIIIISGYNDFEYAKSAMKYGIRDYLLKPVDEDELAGVLGRIKSELGEQSRQKELRKAENEQYRKVLPVMCEVSMNQIISRNNMTADRIKNELHKYGVDTAKNIFTVCVTAPDSCPEVMGNSTAGEYYRRMVSRTMKRYTGAVTFPSARDKNILVSILGNDCEAAAIRKAYRISSLLLSRKLNISISAGVGGSTRQPGMLPDLYEKACTALETRFWSSGAIFAHFTPGLAEDFSQKLSEDMLNKIVLNFKMSNMQTAVTYVETLCSSLRSGQHMTPAIVKEFYWQFLQSVIAMLNIQLPFIRHETMISGVQPYERIMGTQSMDALESCVLEMLQHIYDFYHEKNPIDSNNLIEGAKKLIESNFAGDISLEQVARHIHLSPAYLSEFFKKETGMSFIDYKTIVRIEEAKKLLLLPAMNISDISAKVGYSDPKYFSKLFKKITGKTIFEYKKEAREKEARGI